MDYQTYYQSITKPFFAPPEWAFGLAWGVIYPLIIIAFAYAFLLLKRKQISFSLFLIFIVNIAANLAFTPIQLTLQNTFLATVDILVVLGTLLYFQYKIYSKSKTIFWLLMPYLLWGAFATVLQVTILLIN